MPEREYEDSAHVLVVVDAVYVVHDVRVGGERLRLGLDPDGEDDALVLVVFILDEGAAQRVLFLA